MRTLLIVAYSFTFCLLNVAAQSQETVAIKGIVIDSLERSPLDSCIITWKRGKETGHTSTAGNGQFEIRSQASADTIFITFSRRNYLPYAISLSKQPFHPDTIVLRPESRLMKEVIVKSSVPAIAIKKDTTEYMVDSFAREGTVFIGEILKDLPGIEIADDGTILHNGKPIERIEVNGQTFYDIKGNIALSNIPAGIVSKIQVMDSRSKEEILNGLLGEGNSKTLNIKLKPGVHSFANLGLGTSTRKDVSGNITVNRLNDKKQFGLMGGMNRKNNPGLTENSAFLTTTAESLNGNFRDDLGKKMNYNGNFFSNANGSVQESGRTLQQFFKADSSFTTATRSLNDFNNRIRSANLGLDAIDIDKWNISVNGSYSMGNSGSGSKSSSSVTENGKLKNQMIRTARSKNDNENLNLSFTMSKTFRKPGRTLYFSMNGSGMEARTDLLNLSDNDYYITGAFLKHEQLRQHIVTRNRSRNFSLGMSFTERFGKNLYLSLGSNLNRSSSGTERNIFNIDSLTQQEQYDSAYSRQWTAVQNNSSTNMFLNYNPGKLHLTLRMALNRFHTEREMEKNETIIQDQTNLAPGLSAVYSISKTQALRFNFSSSSQNPNIEQIQPVPDNSNPMFIRQGNPDLRRSFQYNYELSYNNAAAGKTWATSATFMPAYNSIVQAVFFDAFRRNISRYINVDGIYAARVNWNFNSTIAPSKAGSSWGAAGGMSLGRNVFFDNSIMLFTKNYSVSQSVNYARMMSGPNRNRLTASVGFNYNRAISPSNTAGINRSSFNINNRLEWTGRLLSMGEMRSSYQLQFSSTDYNVAKQNSLRYINHTFTHSLNSDPAKKLGIQSNFSYRYNGQNPLPVNRNIFLWSFTGSMKLFKKAGLLSISATDILNSNPQYNRMVGENYIDDVQVARQTGYYTINFAYFLSKTEKKLK